MVICNSMGPLNQCCEIAAISRYCLMSLLSMAIQKDILSHHILLLYKLHYLFGALKMI